MALYNGHPTVKAYSDKSNESGVGSISLDNRRKAAVKNWLEKTAPEALQVVRASTHDLPFQLGCFGETIAATSWMFLGSTASGFSACATCELKPLEHETFIQINWQLPMSPLAQVVLFEKMKAIFDRETSTIQAQSKKKYRLSLDALQNLRNLVCLWAQFHPHLETRVPPQEAAKWRAEMAGGTLKDEDFRYVLELRPETLALSMLPSSKAVAQEQAHQREQQICLQVEKQRMDVVDAQWAFFVSALERDHVLMQKVKDVPLRVSTVLHYKHVKQLAQQAKAGEASQNRFWC